MAFRLKSYTFWILLLLPFLIWTIFTYPLVVKFSTSIYGDYFGDSAAEIAVLRTIRVGNYIFRLGDYLAPLSLFFKGLVRVLPPVPVYNLSILVSFLGTFYAGFYLSRMLGFGNYPAAFFAIAITLAPVRLWYSFEWPTHAQWGFILLYLVFLVRFLRKNRLSDAVLAGLVFSLTLAENYYHGFMLSFFTLFAILFTLVSLWWKRSGHVRRYLWMSVAFALITLIFSSPDLYNFFAPVTGSSGTYGLSLAVSATRGIEDLFTFSARPWHYFVFDIDHPVFGNLALRIHRWIWSQRPYYLTERFFPKEHTLYLGFTLLLLSGYALFRTLVRKKGSPEDHYHVLLFTLSAVALMIFSFPPYVVVGGVRLYLPSYFIYLLIPQVRAYARFGVLVFICNAVVASFGLRFLLQSQPRGPRRLLAFVVPLALVLFEFTNFPPVHNFSAKLPVAYRWLAQQPGNFSYLEYPTRVDYTDKLYQFAHRKKILNPYHQTSAEVNNLLESIGEPDFSACFKSLGGRYIFFHRSQEKTEKQRVVESWGYPAWGTHDVEARRKAEKPPLKEEYFLRNPNFREVKDFGDVFEVN